MCHHDASITTPSKSRETEPSKPTKPKLSSPGLKAGQISKSLAHLSMLSPCSLCLEWIEELVSDGMLGLPKGWPL